MKFQSFLIFNFLLFSTTTCLAQTISLDIGHSIKSQGATSSFGVGEFYYNQALAYQTLPFLEEHFKVKPIGIEGDIKSLEERVSQAKNTDFFISLHHDSIQPQHLHKYQDNKGKHYYYNHDVKGYSIFISKKNPYHRQALYCAEFISQELQKTGFTPNYYHALNIPGENKPLLNELLAIYQYDNLYVLKNNPRPAILIEAGVIVNPKEAQLHSQQEVQQLFGQSIANGMQKCFSS